MNLKTILSYISDISLEKSASAYNPYLEVLLVKGRHQLITKNAIYSFEDKYDNFRQTFQKLDWDKFKPQKVLVLGLGLGSVIYMLEKTFKKKLEFTAVEIDPEIIRLANKYSLSKINSSVEVIQTDGESFLNIDSRKYDLIIMDIFQNAKIPLRFNSLDFLELLGSKLNPKALLLYNRMNISKDDSLLNAKFIDNSRLIFPNQEILEVKNNLILVSDKQFLL